MVTKRHQVHLLIIVHGLWGNPSHVATVAKVIRERHAELAAAAHPDEHIDLEVLVPESNTELMTYDGIDWCAERVVKEIMDRKREIEQDGSRTVTKFSAFGYSLGGLKARYAVGILHAQGFFKTIEPVNFCTFATPHIGLLRDGSFWRRFLEFWGTKLLSRSGKQLFSRDKWSPDGQPLLAVLADKDKLFYKTLSAFKNIHFYANAVKDMTVPFYTGHVSTHDPFLGHTESGIEVVFDEKYAPVLKSYALPAVPPPPPPPKPWYQRFKPTLPPFIRNPFIRGFIYVFFPVLVPLVMLMVIARFSLATHASKKRIRLLERDSMGETRLVQMLRELELGMDNAVADMVDQPGAADPEALRAATAHKSGIEFDVHDADARVQSPEPGAPGVAVRPHRKGEGIFTPMHRRMAGNINGIPHLRKHIAYIPEYVNAHAIIVVRDPVQFDWHHKGLGVVRHWADGFDF